MDTVDKKSPIPMYYQLQKIILDKIQTGVWMPKTQIPPERELAEVYGLSRMTVRQALNELTRSGILIREVGSGTYVAEPKFTQGLSSLTSFSEDMRARGLRPSAQVIHAGIQPAGVQLANTLGITVGADMVVIQRLRLANDEPMAIEHSSIQFPGCKQVLTDDLSTSLYSILREFGVIPVRARQQISVGVSTKEESHLLDIRVGEPVLRLTRTAYDQNDRAFEYTVSTYRGDKYVFETELVAQEKEVEPSGRN